MRSLLEVGTGFHPELTGRENIFLNGAILGMTKAEIRKKFDEIVAFSDMEEFIDTPVKRYSSGMYVRLAFAVAAHLEPEILIVDEVLAVGDAEFQKKCLGKMRDVAGHGRTVLFVSHNMPTVKQLCGRSILFKDGQISMQGQTEKVITSYFELDSPLSEYQGKPNPNGNPTIVFARLDVKQGEDGFWLDIPLTIWSASPRVCSIEITMSDRSGVPIGFAAAGLMDPERMVNLLSGDNPVRCRIDLPNLANGAYNLSINLAKPWVEFFDKMNGYLGFEMVRSEWGSDRRPLEQNWGYGNLELPLEVAAVNAPILNQKS